MPSRSPNRTPNTPTTAKPQPVLPSKGLGGPRPEVPPEPDPIERTPPYDEALRTAHLAPGGAHQAPGQASTLIEPAGPTTASNAD